MPMNPKTTRQVASYVPAPLKTRMRRIAKAKPRYSISWQIEYALEKAMPDLEALAGFPPKRSGDKLP